MNSAGHGPDDSRRELPSSLQIEISDRAVRTIEAPLLRDQPRSPAKVPSRRLKILTIDDNPDSRGLMGQILKRIGHETKFASCGREALGLLKKADFDLVLMDVQMPEMNGYEVTARIRELPEPTCRVPVIALTANAMTGDSTRAFEAGMDGYLTKPVHLESLKALLDHWAESLESTTWRGNSLRNGTKIAKFPSFSLLTAMGAEMKQTFTFLPLIILFSTLAGCGSGESGSNRTLSASQLKAVNDASMKESVDRFMSVDREFNVIDEDKSLIKSFDLKTSKGGQFTLDIQFKDGSSVIKVGEISRNYNSDALASLYLGDAGSLEIYVLLKEPKTYCPIMTLKSEVNKNSLRIHVCENQPMVR